MQSGTDWETCSHNCQWVPLMAHPWKLMDVDVVHVKNVNNMEELQKVLKKKPH